MSKSEKNTSGLVVVPSALETGLVPKGWTIVSDNLEGSIDLVQLDFKTTVCRDEEEAVSMPTMLQRADEVYAIGSLGLGKLLLDAQRENGRAIPSDLEGIQVSGVNMYSILLPRTILVDDFGHKYRVPYLSKLEPGIGWCIHFRLILCTDWVDFGTAAKFIRRK